MRTAIGAVIFTWAAVWLGGCAPKSPGYERAGKANTSYYGEWYRIDVAIVVPPGQSEEKLRRTIDRAVTDLRTSYEADIVLLRLFDSKDEASDFGWTVGKAIYGPNGSLFGQPGDPFMTKAEFGPSRSAILKKQEADWQRTAEKMGAAAPAEPSPTTPAKPDSARRP